LILATIIYTTKSNQEAKVVTGGGRRKGIGARADVDKDGDGDGNRKKKEKRKKRE